MSDAPGQLCLILHAHLPYVRHPEHPDFLEEDWLFEAITECYIPLLRVFERLDADEIPYRLTLSLSPPLLSMLADPLLQRRYRAHLQRLVKLSGEETERHRDHPALGKLARFYEKFLRSNLDWYEQRWKGKLLDAFRQLRGRGKVELITCGATHAFLPLLSERSRRAQIRVGVESFRRCFGANPPGFWLPECAYAEGLEVMLAEEGIGYFFLDHHGLLYGDSPPVWGAYAPVLTPAKVAAFGRDLESSRQVWSSKEGYPGDPAYREFYRDLGFDAGYEDIRPYLHSDGVRRNLGIKYHRITGQVDLAEKDFYDPEPATEQARVHAGNFHFNRCEQARWLSGKMDRPPVICSYYDAELFGHWWFEGPQFLEAFFRLAAEHPDALEITTPSRVLADHPTLQQQQPSNSSWGAEGHHQVWLNGQNSWIYSYMHRAEARLEKLAEQDLTGLEEQALDQAARELLLAQASDWAFILSTGSTVPYAVRRLREHLHRFHLLAEAVESHEVDPAKLEEIRKQDPVFPWLDYRVFG